MPLHRLPEALAAQIIMTWCELKSISVLDEAICNRNARSYVLEAFANLGCIVRPDGRCSFSQGFLNWLLARKLRISDLDCAIVRRDDHLLLQSVVRHSGAQIQRVVVRSSNWLVNVVASHCRGLREVVFDGLSLSGWQLHHLICNNPQLIKLSLGRCELNDSDVFELQATDCKQLKELYVTESGISSEVCLSLVRRCTNLQRLCLSRMCNFDGLGMAAIVLELPALTALELPGMKLLAAQELEKLCIAAINITVLDLSEIAVTNALLEKFVANNPGLTSIRMQRCGNIYLRGLDVIPKHCKGLEYLDITRTLLDDQALVQLADQCPKLAWLRISHQHRVTDAGIRHIARCCKSLKTVIVDRMEIMGRTAVWDEFPSSVDVQLFSGSTRIS